MNSYLNGKSPYPKVKKNKKDHPDDIEIVQFHKKSEGDDHTI